MLIKCLEFVLANLQRSFGSLCKGKSGPIMTKEYIFMDGYMGEAIALGKGYYWVGSSRLTGDLGCNPYLLVDNGQG